MSHPLRDSCHSVEEIHEIFAHEVVDRGRDANAHSDDAVRQVNHAEVKHFARARRDHSQRASAYAVRLLRRDRSAYAKATARQVRLR